MEFMFPTSVKGKSPQRATLHATSSLEAHRNFISSVPFSGGKIRNPICKLRLRRHRSRTRLPYEDNDLKIHYVLYDNIYKGSRSTASYPEEVNYFEEAL